MFLGPWTLEGVRHSHDPLISLEVNESPGSVNTQTLFEAKPDIALAMHKSLSSKVILDGRKAGGKGQRAA